MGKAGERGEKSSAERMDDPHNRTPTREILDPLNPSKHDEKTIAAFSPFRLLSSRSCFFIVLTPHLPFPLRRSFCPIPSVYRLPTSVALHFVLCSTVTSTLTRPG